MFAKINPVKVARNQPGQGSGRANVKQETKSAAPRQQQTQRAGQQAQRGRDGRQQAIQARRQGNQCVFVYY